MPVVQYPDGEYSIDSTPIIQHLESQCSPERSIYPNDEVLRFLAFLIEDFADEWLTKCVFHYRFTYPADRSYGPKWVMEDTHQHLSSGELDRLTQEFLARQTERMPIVGCIPEHGDLIEQTYHRVLEILESYVASEKFLFGTRPTIGDFGLFGQLKTLATDPTPREIMRDKAPRVDMWVMRMDDTSGVDGDFFALEHLDGSLQQLLNLISEIYLPYLEANSLAFNASEESFSTILRGNKYRQGTFKYQAKCLQVLRDRYKNLSIEAKDKVNDILGGANCGVLIG